MSHILHLDSSPRGSRSVSRALTQEFISHWVKHHPQDTVTYRDVGKHPIPPVDEAWIAGAFSKAEVLSSELVNALQLSDELITEVLKADRYVFGVPMYNFNIPANFKSYIDQVVRINRTFTPAWKGLLKHKKMLILSTRGSRYAAGTDRERVTFSREK